MAGSLALAADYWQIQARQQLEFKDLLVIIPEIIIPT